MAEHPPKEEVIAALPISRVRKIMKTDPDVKQVSQDASYLVTKSTVLHSFFALFIYSSGTIFRIHCSGIL
jgi:hypothetical protein